MQKGVAPILILVVLIIAAIGGTFYFKKLPLKSTPTPIPTFIPSPSPTPIPDHLQLPTPKTTPTSKPTLTPVSTPNNQISIIGNSSCNDKTNTALDLLRNQADIHHQTVIKYVGIIECGESGSGIFVWEEPPRFKVGQATIDSSIVWYASTLAHEACHSKQYRDYLQDNPSSNVPYETYYGKNAEAQCLDVQHDALVKLGAQQYELDYIKNVINTEYWNVDYENRWW